MANFRVRFMPKMMKASWLMLVGFLFLASMDFYSTMSSGDYLPLVEANILYKYIGLWGIGFLNIVAIYLLLSAYGRGKPFIRYSVITAWVYLSVIRIFVIINNWKVVTYLKETAPPMEEVAAVMTTEVKNAAYMNDVIYMLFFMIFYSFIIYAILMMDNKLILRNE